MLFDRSTANIRKYLTPSLGTRLRASPPFAGVYVFVCPEAIASAFVIFTERLNDTPPGSMYPD
jgi:hypothetical protein